MWRSQYSIPRMCTSKSVVIICSYEDGKISNHKRMGRGIESESKNIPDFLARSEANFKIHLHFAFHFQILSSLSPDTCMKRIEIFPFPPQRKYTVIKYPICQYQLPIHITWIKYHEFLLKYLFYVHFNFFIPKQTLKTTQ